MAAGKVYATARDPRSVTHLDAVALPLEVTDPDSVAAVVERTQDVTVLVNNAGIAFGTQFPTSPLDDIRREFEINFYGTPLLARAPVPVIERNGGGHILNVHSVLSWVAEGGAHSASKAAFWSQTNSLRLALKPRGRACRGTQGQARGHRPLGQGRPVRRPPRPVRAARPVTGPESAPRPSL